MKNYINLLKKYLVLMIFMAALNNGWPTYFIIKSFPDLAGQASIMFSIPHYIRIIINLIIAFLLMIDFKRCNLKKFYWASIAALVYPILGIFIFIVAMIDNDYNEN